VLEAIVQHKHIRPQVIYRPVPGRNTICCSQHRHARIQYLVNRNFIATVAAH
jgi:hypothetical protein